MKSEFYCLSIIEDYVSYQAIGMRSELVDRVQMYHC